LGFKADLREYGTGAQILKDLGLSSIRLMTNNPRKIDAMEKLGVRVAERVPLLVNRNAFNSSYLDTKQAKLGHLMTPLAEAVAEDGEL
jgi:GTP cyclohydrolase II